jgi:hypothetical protein
LAALPIGCRAPGRAANALLDHFITHDVDYFDELVTLGRAGLISRQISVANRCIPGCFEADFRRKRLNQHIFLPFPYDQGIMANSERWN